MTIDYICQHTAHEQTCVEDTEALLVSLILRCHSMKTGNDSYCFKSSSTQFRKEVNAIKQSIT